MKTPALRWIGLALVACTLLLMLAEVGWISVFDVPPLHVVIDGDEVFGWDLASLPAGEKAMLAGGVLLALFAVMVAVPLALLVASAGLVIGLVLGVGLPLALMLLVAALVLSPLWLLVALAWWLWRRSATTPTSAVGPANISA